MFAKRSTLILICVCMVIALPACSAAPGADLEKGSISNIQATTIGPVDAVDAPAGTAEVQAGAAGTILPEDTLAASPQPLPDGASLLQSHCSRCHLVQSLEQSTKSRREWGEALEQMEGFGVHLEDSEIVILLDYLAGADGP